LLTIEELKPEDLNPDFRERALLEPLDGAMLEPVESEKLVDIVLDDLIGTSLIDPSILICITFEFVSRSSGLVAGVEFDAALDTGVLVVEMEPPPPP
jgi:hypothetical protein